MDDERERPTGDEPVAGEGVTQEAVDAAEQELETPEDTTNEG